MPHASDRERLRVRVDPESVLYHVSYVAGFVPMDTRHHHIATELIHAASHDHLATVARFEQAPLTEAPCIQLYDLADIETMARCVGVKVTR